MNNQNILLALLEIKKVITRKEAEKIAEFLATNVIPSHYKDAVAAVKEALAEDDDKK